jgi:hypothetical protein
VRVAKIAAATPEGYLAIVMNFAEIARDPAVEPVVLYLSEAKTLQWRINDALGYKPGTMDRVNQRAHVEQYGVSEIKR